MNNRTGRKGVLSTSKVWWVAGIAVTAVAFLISFSVMRAPGGSDAVRSDVEFGAVRNVWGQAAAPVSMIEFGDYQ